MKKILFFLATLPLVAACVRETLVEEPGVKTFNCFTVSVEETEMTKVHTEEGGVIKWDSWDCIGIYSDIQGPVPYYRYANGVFLGDEVSGTQFFAFYPYSDFTYDENNPQKLIFNNTGGSYYENNNYHWFVPMVAKSNDNHLHFRQTGGALRFRIYASFPIQRVILNSNSISMEQLFGPSLVDMCNEIPYLERINSEKTYTSKEVWAGSASFNEGNDVWFSLCPGNIGGGFNVEIQGIVPHSDEPFTFIKETKKPVLIERGKMKTYVINLDEEVGFTSYGKLSLSQEEAIISPSGGNVTVKLVYGGRWKVESDASWCSVSPSEGALDAALRIEVDASDGSQDRVANLTVSSLDDSQQKVICIKQISTASAADWRNCRFGHHSLLIKFTSVYCEFSQMFNDNWNSLDASTRENCHRIDTYGNLLSSDTGPGDPFYVEGVNRLESLYQIGGYPFGILDGRTLIENRTDASYFRELFNVPIQDQKEVYPATTGIAFSSTLLGKEVTVEGMVYAHEAEDYKLTVYLIEDGVPYADTTFDLMLRASLSDILGDVFTISEKNGTYSFRYSASLPDTVNPENLSVLISTYRKFGEHPVIRSHYYGEYYVDNCRKAPLGDTAVLETYGYLDNNGGNEGLQPGDEIIVE